MTRMDIHLNICPTPIAHHEVTVFKPGMLLLTSILAAGLSFSQAQAYPEFQEFSEKHSGKTTDCAMCHVNSGGPIGLGPGQVGGLTPEQFKKLSQARGAMDPGVDVNSPILNHFGNLIIKSLGRKKVIELRKKPAELAVLLGPKSDLDEDGIPDGQEFQDGTDPLNKSHGSPDKLFFINLQKYQGQIFLAALSILLLSYGFMNVIRGFATVARTRQNNAEDTVAEDRSE